MSSELDARRLLPALTLAVLLALLQGAPGAPFGDAPTDSPAGEPSGEEVEVDRPPADPLRKLLESLLSTTKHHRQEFSKEFNSQVRYDFLSHYEISALPASCPRSNFSKEACLRRMLQFLEVYVSILKTVEMECPGSIIPRDTKYYGGLLINELHRQVGDGAPTAGQAQQLLKEMEASDSFHRKMMAHSILYKAHHFLVDSKTVIYKKRSRGGSGRVAVTFYTT